VNWITKISRLVHPGVIRDFTWPAGLQAFGRFNLIYGRNGSGKTTISRVFRCLEQRTPYEPGRVALQVGDALLADTDFPSADVPVRVFNRDFVNDSVFPTGGGDVPPILVVGKENVEKRKEADRAKKEGVAKAGELKLARDSLEQAENELDQFCTGQAKLVKEALRAPGAGPYNDYDKRAYRAQAERMAAAGNGSTHALSEADREALRLQHRATVKPKVSEVVHEFPDLSRLRNEVADTVAKTVASEAIAALKADPALSEWTRHGLRLHKDRQSKACLFCDQALPAERLAALEAHFNEEYERFLQRIGHQIDGIRRIEQQAVLRPPDRAALYDDLQVEYDAAQESMRSALALVATFLSELRERLESKAKLPFLSDALETTVPGVDAGWLEQLNTLIQRHNSTCDNFQARTASARDRLALDMFAQGGEEFARLSSAVDATRAAIAPLEEEVGRLASLVTTLEREIVEHLQPAEELNEDLRNYLGHDELRLDVQGSGYRLLRGGVPADSLSEGEETALALLYFLKSLSDRRFDLANGVVVLDDPVSSLDSNALFLAFGFIKRRTQGAGQLFLLTHNFSFFRQARDWFCHLPGQKKRNVDARPACFYMLAQQPGMARRCSSLRSLDRLLMDYESEYHYLFYCVHQAVGLAADTELERLHGLPNIARRLLEMFLAFRQPHVADRLSKKLEGVEFDDVKKVRILRFVHTHSHGDSIGEPEHDPSLLGEATSVLADLLDLIKTEDPKHYAAMEELMAHDADGDGAR
jgi:wobble nucleotide-excising tRNase